MASEIETVSTRSTGPSTCPVCHAEAVADAGYSPWCERCGWNVDPYPPKPASSRAERRAARARARVDAEHTRLAVTPNARPAGVVPAYALALLVHLGTALIAAATVWVAIASGFAVFVRVPLAALGALIAIDVAPHPQRSGRRRRRQPGTAVAVSRTQAPALWQLIDQVAHGLAVQAPDVVLLTSGVGRGHAVLGVRRRRAIAIGLAGWVALSPAERVAQLAHDIAASRGGCVPDNAVVSAALNSLTRWARMLRTADVRQSASLRTASGLGRGPMEQWAYRRRGGGAARIEGDLGTGLFNVLTALPRYLLAPYAAALLRNARIAGQRCELAADRAAAEIASVTAAVAQLEKSYLDDIVEVCRKRVTRDTSVAWARFLDTFHEVPERQVKRLYLAGRLRRARVDDDHASTSARIDALRDATSSASIGSSDEDHAQILKELTGRLD